MAAPSRLPLSLLTLVLLLVPGLFALRIYARAASKRYQLSRTERIVYSIGFSVSSLVLLFLLSPILFAPITGLATTVADAAGYVTQDQLFGLGIAEVVALYLLQVAAALLIAYLSGYIVNVEASKNRELDRRPPWAYAFETSVGETIKVGLTDGRVIRGQFNEAAWDSQEQDLYIEDPVELHHDDSRDPRDMGRSMLVAADSVSFVSFVDDPDSESVTDFFELLTLREELTQEYEEIQASVSNELENVLGKGGTDEDRVYEWSADTDTIDYIAEVYSGEHDPVSDKAGDNTDELG